MADRLISQLDRLDLTKRSNKMFVAGFAAIGAYYLGMAAYTVCKGIMKYVVLPRRNLSQRYGSGWALVTGASDGIGKAYCMELAKSGFNIVLMARNHAKLEAVAKEIRNVYKVQTKIIVYDFMNLAS